MADQILILNRQQLAQFLPSHEAIKAFESLFKYASQTAPEVADDLAVLVASFRSEGSKLSAFSDKVDSLEQSIQRLINSNKDLLNSLEEIKQIIARRSANEAELLKRIQNLEMIVGV